ncbi:MAG TPA: hypothetical protein VMH41_09840 [Mycobacteriales bacterium]|nr:hypothetical protein [Mycobacteriales bacterium]
MTQPDHEDDRADSEPPEHDLQLVKKAAPKANINLGEAVAFGAIFVVIHLSEKVSDAFRRLRGRPVPDRWQRRI